LQAMGCAAVLNPGTSVSREISRQQLIGSLHPTDLAFARQPGKGSKGMPDSSPHAGQLRAGRFSGNHQIYLLTTVVNDRSPIFRDCRLGRLVVDEFRLAEMEGAARSLAWVVMPDHFHWLVELQSGSLSRLMRRAKSRSAHSINRARGVPCQVWQKGYHDRALRREEDLKDVARYIVANPLRAGLVKRVGDYPLWDAIWL